MMDSVKEAPNMRLVEMRVNQESTSASDGRRLWTIFKPKKDCQQVLDQWGSNTFRPPVMGRYESYPELGVIHCNMHTDLTSLQIDVFACLILNITDAAENPFECVQEMSRTLKLRQWQKKENPEYIYKVIFSYLLLPEEFKQDSSIKSALFDYAHDKYDEYMGIKFLGSRVNKIGLGYLDELFDNMGKKISKFPKYIQNDFMTRLQVVLQILETSDVESARNALRSLDNYVTNVIQCSSITPTSFFGNHGI